MVFVQITLMLCWQYVGTTACCTCSSFPQPIHLLQLVPYTQLFSSFITSFFWMLWSCGWLYSEQDGGNAHDLGSWWHWAFWPDCSTNNWESYVVSRIHKAIISQWDTWWEINITSCLRRSCQLQMCQHLICIVSSHKSSSCPSRRLWLQPAQTPPVPDVSQLFQGLIAAGLVVMALQYCLELHSHKMTCLRLSLSSISSLNQFQ